jgi:hypothetical protein
MKPEKCDLIRDLLDDDQTTVREATLLAGGRILRRRRRQRAGIRIATLLAVVALAAIAARQTSSPRADAIAASGPNPPAPTTERAAEELSDEELLALFPETPVGLATLADGRQRLIFPRKEDRERFVGNL